MAARVPMQVPKAHFVLGTPLDAAFEGLKKATFGMGCFWGAERKFYQLKDGIVSTAVGYAGGHLEHPTYREVCSGSTGHAEVVRIVFDPSKTTYKTLLDTFWDNHDPTQKDRQGNDCGTQYRSVIYYEDDEQKALAEATRDAFQAKLSAKGYSSIKTEILPAAPNTFYFAEEYHQQYLAKNPGGYCGLRSLNCYN